MNLQPVLVVAVLPWLPLSGVSAQEAAPSPTLKLVTKIERLKQDRNYQDADLRETLQHLAREGKIVLELQKEVTGTFSLKIDEPVAPFEALNRIADKVHLFFEETSNTNGVTTYIVWARSDFKPSGAATPEPEKSHGEFWQSPTGIASAATDMATKMDDGMATYLAKPETAAKRAKFYKNLYDALLKEGFSKEDALKMTVESVYPGQNDDKSSGKK